MTRPFEITDYPLPNGTLIEANAGTGKTYSVAAYVALAIASDESLRIGNVLVTTFTRNAAAELRDRIRGRIVAAAAVLRGNAPAGYERDPLDQHLLDDATGRVAKALRLERAIAEFDTASIGTIHAFCSRMLRLAGVQVSDAGNEELLEQVVDEVVNDAVVAEAAGDQALCWSEKPLRQLVRAMIRDPFVSPFEGDGRTDREKASAARAIEVVRRCAGRVYDRMRSCPSFDDLLRRAWDEVRKTGPQGAAFREELRRRFRIGIVDEAQDTSELQWRFLHAIFPPDADAETSRALLAVGDPKQAIYSFRGADVTAYVRFANESARAHYTLATNYRSDGPLLAGLNWLMSGAEFGNDIPYRTVAPAAGREASRLTGLHPVELLDTGALPLVEGTVRKVYALLTHSCYESVSDRSFTPGEICVLVQLNAEGARIERALTELGIPAVIGGVASVMAGQMAEDIRVLLEAMEQPSRPGRVRRAGATVFFGHALAEVGQVDEHEMQQIQDRIGALHRVLQRSGVAAFAAEVMGDEKLADRLAAGPDGERQVVDFSHVIELLQEGSFGRGCHARELLKRFADLAACDEKADRVIRRVESDDEAVKIMSVHAAKGLEFPCVVVAGDWMPRRKVGVPVAFYRGGVRALDVGPAVPGLRIAESSKAAILDAANEEITRLLYVAVTRPRHHLCILRAGAWQESLLVGALPAMPVQSSDIPHGLRDVLAVRAAAEFPLARTWRPATAAHEGESTADITPLPDRVAQTVMPTSFSRIHALASGRIVENRTEDGRENDEPFSADEQANASESDVAAAPRIPPPSDVARLSIPDLPAGKAFGTVVHEILEQFVPSPQPELAAISAAIDALVREKATLRSVVGHQAQLAAMLTAAVQTPFGGPALFAQHRFVDFPANERMSEMPFDMAVAGIAEGVLASDIGRVLKTQLRGDDPLEAYADRLSSREFDVPLAGLVSGTIDVVLRLPNQPADDPRLVIADYKTNRLHGRDDHSPLAAYAPAGLVSAMTRNDYPLQALVYGTAVYRMLRWRLGRTKPAGWDPGSCIAGIVYAFVRGMCGPSTPVDAAGRSYGVFTWQPPAGMWRRLSNLLAGDRKGL